MSICWKRDRGLVLLCGPLHCQGTIVTVELLNTNLELEADADSRIDSDVRSTSRTTEPYGPAIHQMQQFAELLDLPLMCVDVARGLVLGTSDANQLMFLPMEVCEWLTTLRGPAVMEYGAEINFFALPLPPSELAPLAAIGFTASPAALRSSDVVLAASEHNWSQSRLDRWSARQTYCPTRHLSVLLSLVDREREQRRQQEDLEFEVEQLSDQIESTYEEISLLHSLTRNLQISRSPRDLAELCLSRMHTVIRAEADVIWFSDRQGESHSLVRGNLPFDEIGMARLLACFDDHDWSRPLVKNHVPRTLLGADFPGLNEFAIVPIAQGAHRSGWILSCNLPDGREYGTVEASLLNSIATILGTHLRNIDLYRQHQTLLLSFVRSLVSTLDAKDPYTRGHSERVALVARRLGEELHLPEVDLRDIYLSGLLHDIGKIGIDDRILRKPGSLTDEEFRQIQRHPMVGYSILKELKNLHRVLPGVRNHHECFNGTGYPDRLAGEDIPLMARILAVADSYDAMGSDRPYRKGLPLEKIEAIFRRGAGHQWDAAVIDAYFAARDDIQSLCNDYTPAGANLLASPADLD